MPKLILIALIAGLPNLLSAGVPDARDYSGPAWSPYLVGALIGVLAWFTFAISDKPIGASSAYASAAGLLGKLFARKHTESLNYYKDNPPKLDWELLFVGSAILGAFIAALTGGEITNRTLPPFWEERFGTGSVALRVGIGFLGGVLMALGARIAGGCTSGHGISGTLQLNVASWIAVICIFAGGALLANLIYRL
ncbi:MAG: YeeE/YedE family protein [Verrucomicrobia bacterium]|nr:YeeE/YedE family protein [Verrucomicrobiota bacterium]